MQSDEDILVPIQIQLKSKDLQKILIHYRNKGYVNLWINFNSRHIDGINFAGVRTILRIIDKEIGLTNTVLYTHI